MKELGEYGRDMEILYLYDICKKTVEETSVKEIDTLKKINQIRKEFQYLISLNQEELRTRTSIPGEIFWMLEEINYNMDVSVLLALSGYYRHAHSSLRSILEFTLLSVYYCDHSIEFQWWEKGDEPITISGVVNYIQKLSWFKDYGKILEKRKEGNLNKLKDDTNELYKNLSRYVHGQRKERREAEPSPIWPKDRTPKYDRGKFNHWFDHFKRTYENCSTILIINYWDFPIEKLKTFKMLSQERVETLRDFLNYMQKRI